MAKQCKADGCDSPVFANNYCKYHQYKRRMGTKRKREYKYTREKKKSLKKAYFGFKTQIEMFNHIWETQPHICFITGKPIKEYDLRNFMHVLRKGQYTYFKLNPENMRLGLPDVHHAVDNFEEGFREIYPEIDFDKWFNLQEEMKIKYEQFKEENLLA